MTTETPFSLFTGVLARLDKNKKRQFWMLLGGSVAIALGEVGAAGTIALYASALSNPDTITSSTIFLKASSVFPWLPQLSAKELLVQLGITVVAFVIVKNILNTLVQYAHTAYMANISGNFGEAMLMGLMRMPYPWILTKNSADLITTVNWARGTGSFLNGIFKIASDILIICFLLSALLMINTGIVLGSLAGLGFVGYILFSRLKPIIDKAALLFTEHTRSANVHLTKGLQGIKDIKVFGKEQAFVEDFLVDVYAVPRLNAQQKVWGLLPGFILESLGFSALCGATYYMYFHSGDSPAKVTETIAFIAVAAWRGLPAVIRILASITSVRNYIPPVQNTLHTFSIIDEMQEPLFEAEQATITMKTEYSLKGVAYKYIDAKEYALDDINFDVLKGESIGIIGHSGAGKSTLTDIMIGLLRPQRGMCLVDGAKLNKRSLKAWTNRVGYVPQSPYIYDGTLAENIAFGFKHDSIDYDRLHSSITMSAVSEFIDQLPNGVNTQIGERGARLSGGQQQRVCIARALYTKPDILIFDEATSSLDTKSEKLIQETIIELKGAVTMIIVAHRLTTVEDCDKILWLDSGKVRMFGKAATVLQCYNEAVASPNEAPSEARL